MNCADCGGPMRLEEDKEYLVCEFCRNIFFPEPDADGIRVLGEPAAEVCPACRIPLVHAASSGYRFLYCSRCRGMLINMYRFVALVHELRAHREAPPEEPHSFNPKDLSRHVRCPRCGREMDTHAYAGPGGIVIDSCSDCHLDWLDAGEVMRIVRGPDTTFELPYQRE